MKTLFGKLMGQKPVIALILFGGLVGAAHAADLQNCQSAPMVKNLRSYSARCGAATTPAPRELTKKDIKRMAANAKTADDHLTIARYYEAQADSKEAQAAGYEEAAAAYRHNPAPKNMMSPTTVGRYDYLAQGFRKEAAADHALAAAQQQMAKSAGVVAAPTTPAQ